MSTETPRHGNDAPTVLDRLDALEFVVGQLALAFEADSADMRERLPSRPANAGCEDGNAEPFTVEGFRGWLELCVQRMEAHKSAPAALRAAIARAAHDICSSVGSGSSTPPTKSAHP